MYLLLVIYSLFNMWDVSWGTREVPKDDGEEKQQAIEKVWLSIYSLYSLIQQINMQLGK